MEISNISYHMQLTNPLHYVKDDSVEEIKLFYLQSSSLDSGQQMGINIFHPNSETCREAISFWSPP